MGVRQSTIEVTEKSEVEYIIDALNESSVYYKKTIKKNSTCSQRALQASFAFMAVSMLIPWTVVRLSFVALQLVCVGVFMHYTFKEKHIFKEWASYMEYQNEYIKALEYDK